MTFEQLQEEGEQVDEQGHQLVRWGYRTMLIYELGGQHWGIQAYVTTGDEGGVTPESEPFRIERVEIISKEWKRCD